MKKVFKPVSHQPLAAAVQLSATTNVWVSCGRCCEQHGNTVL